MRGGTINLNDTETIDTDGPSVPGQVPTAGTVVLEVPTAESGAGGPVSENVLRPGSVVDRYRIVRSIAAGGMARVYEAVHAFTNKTIALKVMRARYSDRRDLIERFRHEAMALSSIRHPNVVYVENAGLTQEGHVFIAMELLQGKNLRELIRDRTRLEVPEALKLVSQVVKGVAAAHAISVIHRDLKPENIFCVENAEAKVLDLGTAKFAGDNAPTTQTAFGKVLGTAAYIAPERLNGEAGDERCDVYSLGLVLYECIAGHHPMAPHGKWPNAVEMATRQVTLNPPPIRGVPSRVNAVVSKAIQKQPQRRFSSMLEFGRAIEVALGEPDGASGARRLEKRRWHRVRAAIAWGAVAGVVVSAGFFRFGNHRGVSGTSGPELSGSVPAQQDIDPAAQLGAKLPLRPPMPAAAAAASEPAPAVSSISTSIPAENPGLGPGAVSTNRASKLAGSAAVTRPTAKLPVERAETRSLTAASSAVSARPPSTPARAAKEDLPASGL